jgi:DNA recombination protein RmuC
MDAFLVGIAALAGILVGFWLRGIDARAEIALLDQRNRDMSEALGRTRTELEKSAPDSTARAAFESLASEREKIIGQMTIEHERLRTEVQAKAEAERAQATRVSELEAHLRNEREKNPESLAFLENARRTLASQLEGVVAEVIAKKSGSLSGDNQGELLSLISPLREQLNEFREKIEKVQLDSNSGVTKLEALIGALGGLNQQLAQEARNLSTALRGSSRAQGDWGEFILRDLLEKAGLREGEQYSFQQSFEDLKSENADRRGSQRTEVVVHLPAGRHLLIDAKVPLGSYIDSVNAEAEEDRVAATREHLKSLRGHVARVANASYHGLPGIKTPDFVVLFVPVEPALLAALQGDSDLWSDAYEKGVLLAGPTTLLYVIRIVNILWRQEDQNRVVKELTDHGATLYSKFSAFVSDIDGLGESLRNASARYDDARKKLTDGRDNLAGKFEEFRQLSAQTEQARPPRPIPYNWVSAPASESGRLSFESEEGEMFELAAEAAATNGYHHERAQELELEEAPYSAS